MERAYLPEAVVSFLEAISDEQTEQRAVQPARRFAQAGLLEKAVGSLLQAGMHRATVGLSGRAPASGQRAGAARTPARHLKRAQTEFDLQIALGLRCWRQEGEGQPPHRRSFFALWGEK